MNRFRKWLIHKLGGYTKEEYKKLAFSPVEYKKINIKLETIKAIHYLDDYRIFNCSQDDIENYLRDMLNKKIFSYIRPEYCWEQDGKQIRYIAKIELPSQYLKGVEDDE